MKKLLAVPFHKQRFANSCLPACIKMVLAYYGDRARERTLYRMGKLPGHPGSWDVKIAPYLIKTGYAVTSYWNAGMKAWRMKPVTVEAFNQAFTIARKAGFLHKRNATINLIKKLINKGTPVLAEVDADIFYGERFGVTHMVVVIGYDAGHLIVHDPDPHFGETRRKVRLAHFKKSWEQLAGLAGRSMIIIEKQSSKTARLKKQ